VIALPQPNDLTSLVVRTDFHDDHAWQALQAAIDSADEYRNATYVDDRACTGITVEDLIQANAAAADDHKRFHLFLADAVTMTSAEHLLLAVDLHDEPGRSFRVPHHRYAEISKNLVIANLDFADFADVVDNSGAYRGFGDD